MKYLTSVLFFVSTFPLLAQDWTPANHAGIINMSGTSPGGYDLDVTRSVSGTTGFKIFNTNGVGRSILILGEGWGGKYGHIAYHGQSHVSDPGYTQTYRPNSITLTGSNTGGLGLISAADIRFQTGGEADGNQKMIITPVGNVGIGTSSPTAKLDVRGTVSINKGEFGISELVISNTAENPGNYSSYWKDGTGGNVDSQTRLLLKNPNAGIGFANGLYVGLDQAYSNKSYTLGTKDATPLAFYTSGKERLTVSPTGTVSINKGDFGISELVISNTAENPGNYSSYWKDGTGGNVDVQTRLLLKNPNAGTGFANGLYIGLDQAYANKSYTLGTKDATPLCFYSSGVERFRISSDGSVGIGTSGATGYKLSVAGKAIAEEITVKLQTNWPDYVFEKDYNLPSLDSIKTYIDQHKHLPEVPSAKEMEANGVNLGEMNILLLKKMEEMTLYIIELNKTIQQQNGRLDKLETSTK